MQKAIDGASKWVDGRMAPADLVAVAAIGSSLQILTDFTSSKEQVRSALTSLAAASGTAFDAVDTSTASTDDAAQSATDDATTIDQSAQELDTFNNDVRLRALKTLAEALQPIQQKKAILYFSSGLQRSGTDNQVELRAAVNAALRANVAIYPIDARGLQAIVPGGSARQASRGGLGAFSGSSVANQFTQLAAQQDTLTSLASDTGGTAFTDSNDFGEAFTKVERDISAYYILGFSSTNANRDGRFRRISVRVKNRGNVRVQAKDGYYADRDFAHTAKTDREVQLQEQLMTPIPSTDVPRLRLRGLVPAGRGQVLRADLRRGSRFGGPAVGGRGNARCRRIHPRRARRADRPHPRHADGASAGEDNLATRQILYQTNVTLPPGRFTVKVVVRENGGGLTGTFETPITVPELKQSSVKVSSLVLSTQLRDQAGKKTTSPLVKDGVEIVPNLTHIVGQRSAGLLLLRGLRSGIRQRRAETADQPGLLSRQGAGVRDAGRRAHADRRRGTARRAVPVRTAGRQPDTRALHLPGEHHRRSQRTLRVPAAADVRPLKTPPRSAAIDPPSPRRL